MWHQHACMFGILSTFSVLINAIISVNLELPGHSFTLSNDEKFIIGESIQKTIQKKSYIEILDCIACLTYWLNAYILAILPYKFGFHRNHRYKIISNLFWDLIVKPYIWMSTLYSVYTFLVLLDEIGSFDNRISVYLNEMLAMIRSKNLTADEFTMYTNHFENIQREYQCCGVHSITDWFGITDYQEVNNTSISQHPWKTITYHIPKSCCNPEKILTCSKKFTDAIELKSYQVTGYPSFHYETLPLYTDGCLNRIVDDEKTIMYDFITKYSVISICLHVIRLITCYIVYHQTQPTSKHKSNTNQRYSLRKSNDFTTFENIRYISNAQLSSACQSYWLFGQLANLQVPFAKFKSQWLEKGIRIGWMLIIKNKYYMTFLRRIQFKENKVRMSRFRRFLRNWLPAFEMIVYTDSSDKAEIEANKIYGGYVAQLCRAIFFLLFGIFASEIMLATIIPLKAKSLELPTGDKKIPDEIIRRDAELLSQDVIWITKIFIRVTIILAAIISRRFRCLLLLIIPNLAQTIGLSYLGSELLHVSVTGPMRNSEHNIISAAESLTCFMKLAYNMTKEATDFLERGKQETSEEGDMNFMETINKRSEQIREKINQYNESYEKINREIEKAKIMAQRAEAFLDTAENKTNVYARMSAEMAKKAKDGMIKKAEASKDSVKSLLKGKQSNDSILKKISDRIENGLRLENSIENRMLTTCMVFYKTRATICTQSSIEACGRLQTILIATTWYPILIKNACIRRVAAGAACPTNEALEEAVDKCSSTLSKIGFSSGFGPSFLQAQEELSKIRQAFQFTFGRQILHTEEISHWISQKSGAINRIAKRTKEIIHVVFELSLILSVLLKLLCFLVFYKSHKYITNYLMDPNFDNIYIESTFEQIDQRRSMELRETLLPLKKYELNNVIWHQKVYTKSELRRVIRNLVKVVGFGFCLAVLFTIDRYMTEAIQVLDEVANTKFKIGGETIDNDEMTETPMTADKKPVGIHGDGIFTELLNKTMKVIQYISKIDLAYDLSVCSPKAEHIHYEYFLRFILLWALMILVCLLSGYMLRIRHKLLDFFYPHRLKRRVIHLYNILLVNRRRRMTIARNLLVHQSRQNRLQETAEETSQYSLIYKINPFLANLLKQNKVNCIVCMERYPVDKKSLIYVCPYDDTAICQYCLTTLFNKHKVCITCLDRNYTRLDKINKNISTLKEIIVNDLPDPSLIR
uniref:DC_STAMP domain-containing protein n=1 Tax=Trichobilharzia regenti TaxID=157069 RepID=A0AA85JXT1_TRIRE|nr:unnamed protein product [Trichobilharzia regenti]